MEENKKKKKKKKHGLKLTIEEINSSSNDTEQKKTFLIKADSYLFLKYNNKSNKLDKIIIGDQHGKMKEGEKFLFAVEIGKDNARLNNPLYKGLHKIKENFMNDFNKHIKSKLYKIIKKCDDENIINDEKKNMNYSHNLRFYDVIGLDGVSLNLKEFNLNNKEEKNRNEKPLTTFKLDHGNNDNICNICEKGDLGPDNPLIRFCLCEEFTHFNCKKEKIKSSKEEISKDCFKYDIRNCPKCNEIIPLNFVFNNKLYDLFEVPDNNLKEDFLLFETFDYMNDQGQYLKNIFYIKINKEKENILIVGNNKEKNIINKYDKLIKIDKNLEPFEQAMIVCDKLNKTLKIININENNNIFVLQENILLKPDDDMLYLKYENYQIGVKLIKKNEFDEVEKEMNKNQKIIEERME